jgi:anti-sigma B factor antagonist
MTEPPSGRSPDDVPFEGAVEATLNVHLEWLRLLRLSGELDIATAPILRQAGEILAGQPAQDLVIDMSGVTFMDACGLGALIAVAATQQELGAKLSCIGISGLTRELFTVAGVSVLLDATEATRSA